MNYAHIEFAHIYNDNDFGQEQIDSIIILKKLMAKFIEEDKKFVTSILIDDFNVKRQQWGIQYLINNIDSFDIKPDFIAFEGSFIAVAEQIINEIPKEFKKTETFRKDNKKVLFYNDGQRKIALKDIYNNNVKYKCVILSCAWLLCKLGIKEYPLNSFIQLKENSSLYSQNIISILPSKYRYVEDNVLHIISAIGFNQYINKIQYIFY